MKQNREQRRKDAKAAATPTSCTQRIAHISITKNDLVNALRWLFEHYDFEEDRT